ncbi:MAG TPA: SprT-like domain-containing protein [Candidatus Acidoferrales bacterium]|nr:SprT-like domain-containing protein [Candidatus Acidoferrales bacterium]
MRTRQRRVPGSSSKAIRNQIKRKLVPGGERIFQRIYTRLGCEGRPPYFVVEFHPYTGLTLTVRVREDTAYVRLSDALHDAPTPVVEAAAAILLGRLYRRQPPKDMLELYRQFSYARSTRERLHRLRQNRARRVDHVPAGKHHDLAPLFANLNQSYFQNLLPLPRLSWSKRGWRSLLGCFDPALHQIVLNRELDRETVPEYVVAYVLYHEMLHLKHPMKFARRRRESHSPSFRKEEKIFRDYQRAMKFLDRFPAR